MTIVMDPTSEHRPASWQANDRLTSIEGKTIGLLDISKARGDIFLDRLSALLEAKGAVVKRYRKPTFAKPAPVDLRHQIATECHAVIEALAD
jgi:hypothetical protein